MKKPVILLVEHDDIQRHQLHSLLLRQAFEVIVLSDANEIFRAFRQKRSPDLLIVNAVLEAASDGLEVVRLLRQGKRELPVLLLAPNGSEELAIAALRAGITDYLKQPFSCEELLTSVHRCLADRCSQESVGIPEPMTSGLIPLIGESSQMQDIKASLCKLASTDTRLLTVREWLFGSQLGSVVACPQCTQQLELTFHLSKICATHDEIQPEILMVEADGYTATFRLPNSEDLAAIRADGGTHDDVATVRRSLLSRCLLQTQREEQLPPQVPDKMMDDSIDELPPPLITAIAEKMEQADPQANVQLNLSCADCGHRWLAAFDIVSYLWNEIDHWARRILREVHVLASAYGWREADILSMRVQRRQCYLEMIGKTA